MSPQLMTEPSGEVIRQETEALYEVAYGQWEELPTMGAYATLIALLLYRRLHEFVTSQQLGLVLSEALLILDQEKNLRRRPDVAFLAADAWPLNQEIPVSGDFDHPPTLAIEVISPNDRAGNIMLKLKEYFSYGTREVWVIYPETQEIYQYVASDRVTILGITDKLSSESLLPGFSLEVRNVFQRTGANLLS